MASDTTMTRAEREALGRALLQAAHEAKAQREVDMPDAETAIRSLWRAHYRLTELGWRDPAYAPKDGTPLELIECGSTGIHPGYRDEHGFWILDGDTWPSRPVLFRLAKQVTP